MGSQTGLRPVFLSCKDPYPYPYINKIAMNTIHKYHLYHVIWQQCKHITVLNAAAATKKSLEKVESLLKKDSIHYDKLGLVESNYISYGNDLKISIDQIKQGYKNWLKEYMVN